jgi:hypothetical protein
MHQPLQVVPPIGCNKYFKVIDDLWHRVSLNHKQNKEEMATSKGKGALVQHNKCKMKRNKCEIILNKCERMMNKCNCDKYMSFARNTKDRGICWK